MRQQSVYVWLAAGQRRESKYWGYWFGVLIDVFELRPVRKIAAQEDAREVYPQDRVIRWVIASCGLTSFFWCITIITSLHWFCTRKTLRDEDKVVMMGGKGSWERWIGCTHVIHYELEKDARFSTHNLWICRDPLLMKWKWWRNKFHA